MKISDVTTKSFLGAQGATANSYVLINYEDNNTSKPITYKATIDELGRAITNSLHLYKETANGAVTTTVYNNTYRDGTANSFITNEQRIKLNALPDANIPSDLHYLVYDSEAEYYGGYGIASLGSQEVDGMIDKILSQGYIDIEGTHGKYVFVDSGSLYYYNPSASAKLTLLNLSENNNNNNNNDNDNGEPFNPDSYVTYDARHIVFMSLNPSTSKCAYYDTEESTWKNIPIPRIVAASIPEESDYIEWDGIYAQDRHLALDSIAHIGTSDNRPAIYDNEDTFIGYLSST